MKNRKHLNRVLSLFLSALILFSLCIPASASSVSANTGSLSPSPLDNSPQPRGFVKTEVLYLETNVFYDFFYDSNWWGETNLTITFKSSEGPTSIAVGVWDNDGYTSSRRLSVGEAASFKINPHSFRIDATNKAGPNGNVTLVITLT